MRSPPATALPAVLCLSLLLLGCATAEKPAPQLPATHTVAAQPLAPPRMSSPDAVAQPVAAQPLELMPVENRVRRDLPGVYDMNMVSRTPVSRFQVRPQYPPELRRAGVA